MIRKILVLLFLALSFFVQSHPLHLTITNIDIKQDSVKVSVRFFEDDLKMLMVHEGLISDSVQWTDTTTQLGNALQTFINKYLGLKTDSADVVLTYVNHQLGGLNLVVTLTSVINSGRKSFGFTNLLMTKYFGDQVNLMIINNNGIEKGFELDSQKTTETIYL